MELEPGLQQLKLAASEQQLAQLRSYVAYLQKWNRAYNLTSIRSRPEIIVRHLLDSAAVIPHLPPGDRLLDVGAGAGLPGLIIAILRPDMQVTVVDSVGKKALFMRHIQRQLALENVQVIEARAEELEAETPWPLVISRAFAALGEFIRLTMPLLSADGSWLAMKGRLDAAEQQYLPKGVELAAIQRLCVPGLDEERHLLVARHRNSGAADA